MCPVRTPLQPDPSHSLPPHTDLSAPSAQHPARSPANSASNAPCLIILTLSTTFPNDTAPSQPLPSIYSSSLFLFFFHFHSYTISYYSLTTHSSSPHIPFPNYPTFPPSPLLKNCSLVSCSRPLDP